MGQRPVIVLAIDTATSDLVVGLVEAAISDTSGGVPANVFGSVLAESVERTRAHNERLVPTVSALLAETNLDYADLEAIVVGCGPGPFTGLRVGMATATAIGQARNIPVHGVVTHDAIAAELLRDGAGASCLVVTDARRREVYWARYADGARVAGPGVCRPAELPVIGADEVLSVPAHLAEAVEEATGARRTVECAPSASGLVAAADLGAKPAPLVAHYLRRPDAVPPKLAPRSTAIPDVSALIAAGDTEGQRP